MKINKKIFPIAFLVVFLIIMPLFISCTTLKAILQKSDATNQAGIETTTTENITGTDTTGSSSTGTGETSGTTQNTGNTDASIAGNLNLIYFDVGSSQESNHFEHRVANIFSVKPDGTDKKLIFSDIDEKYDLGNVYSVSPDGTKILCHFVEGGRGAYSYLSILELSTGQMKKLVEFDNINSETTGFQVDFYGNPIWSNDSKSIAYELISTPAAAPSNFRDAGIHVVNIETAKESEVIVDMGGVSVRTTTFLYPVLFSIDDSLIFAISRIFNPDSRNDALYPINSAGGTFADSIINMESFAGKGPEIIQSFDNFKLLKSENKIVFQVLGDFEEDGDLWICNTDGSELKKLTSDPDLREQQPSINENPGKPGIIAYIGTKRYGTVSNQIPSGDINVINSDSSNNEKLTDFIIGPSKPLYSPDGKYIAFLFSNYDENKINITGNDVKLLNTTTRESVTVNPQGYIFDVIGWVISK